MLLTDLVLNLLRGLGGGGGMHEDRIPAQSERHGIAQQLCRKSSWATNLPSMDNSRPDSLGKTMSLRNP